MRLKLTKRAVENLSPAAERYTVHDTDLTGFQVRVTPGGRKTYHVYYRSRSGQERRPKIGVHGQITTEQARKIARDWLAEVTAGGDPSEARRTARASVTVADLCDRYMADHATSKAKASTCRQYQWLIDKYIKPALGSCKLADLSRTHVEAFHRRAATTPRNANQALSLLSTMCRRAADWGDLPAGSNPCAGIRPYSTRKLERYLTEPEMTRLSDTLDRFETERRASAHAIAAIRILLATGCRKNEICRLEWDEVDWARKELRLRDSKTGAKRVPLSSAALDLLRDVPPVPGNPYVIAGFRPGMPLGGLQHIWERIRREAGLEDVRLHDLRHSYASWAISDGVPLAVVGRLLGHKTPQATSRYAHLADDPVRDAAERVGNALGRRARESA